METRYSKIDHDVHCCSSANFIPSREEQQSRYINHRCTNNIILNKIIVSFTKECGGNARQLISDPDVPVNISANPFLEGDNAKVDPSQLEISESNTGDQSAWCSVLPPNAYRVAYDPYLKFEFNSTYLIEIVKISGRDVNNRFVIALTIKNDTGHGQGFTSINDNGIPNVSQFCYNIIDA